MTFRVLVYDLRVLKKTLAGVRALSRFNVHLMRFGARVFMQMAENNRHGVRRLDRSSISMYYTQSDINKTAMINRLTRLLPLVNKQIDDWTPFLLYARRMLIYSRIFFFLESASEIRLVSKLRSRRAAASSGFTATLIKALQLRSLQGNDEKKASSETWGTRFHSWKRSFFPILV